jgi:sodium-dependent dicarboxylate transporter 2/3/5
MWISNTATTAMMLPIGLSVIELFRDRSPRGELVGESSFGVCLMLSIAYAASIGGVSTIIGSPPNGFLVGFIKENYSVEISFLTWMGIGLPVVVCMLPITWWLLTRVLHPLPRSSPPGADELIGRELSRLGRISHGEWTTLVVFALAVAGWITRPLLQDLLGIQLDDAGIAITAGVALFVIPVDVKRRLFAIDWQTARKMPWGVLILFGGGMSLAAAVKRTGVADFIGSQTAAFGGVHPLILMLIVTTGMIFLTELTSNLATTATIIPILAALAPGLGLHPFALIVPATIAASCAFMLPVATPPNAILFGSGFITIPQMCRAGMWLNLIGIALVTALVYGLGLKLLGV